MLIFPKYNMCKDNGDAIDREWGGFCQNGLSSDLLLFTTTPCAEGRHFFHIEEVVTGDYEKTFELTENCEIDPPYIVVFLGCFSFVALTFAATCLYTDHHRE